jgi:phosphoribosylformimino-5-aminoimidazole carboxamide ribotide isomerase
MGRRRTLFRPCIDLRGGKVTQIVGGTLNDSDAAAVKTNFESAQGADHFAALYRKDGLQGGHVILLGPGNEEAALQALKAYPGGLQVGGGVTPETARRWLDAGASHVIVTSAIFDGARLDFDKLKALTECVGRDRLVLDLSCRRRHVTNGTAGWYVATNRWQTVTDYEITAANVARLEEYCAEFLVHAADVEGLQGGIDEDLVRLLGSCVKVPTTYAGGAKSLDDLELVDRLSGGKVDLTIGSALDIFGGAGVMYADCVAYNKRALAEDDSRGSLEDTRRITPNTLGVPVPDPAANVDHAAIYTEYAEYLTGQRFNGWKD